MARCWNPRASEARRIEECYKNGFVVPNLQTSQDSSPTLSLARSLIDTEFDKPFSVVESAFTAASVLNGTQGLDHIGRPHAWTLHQSAHLDFQLSPYSFDTPPFLECSMTGSRPPYKHRHRTTTQQNLPKCQATANKPPTNQ